MAPLSLSLRTSATTHRTRCHGELHAIGGVAVRVCQERPIYRAKRRVARALERGAHRIACAGFTHPSGTRSAGLAGAIGPVGVNIERPRSAFDDLSRDHDLLDAFEARQVEHSI